MICKVRDFYGYRLGIGLLIEEIFFVMLFMNLLIRASRYLEVLREVFFKTRDSKSCGFLIFQMQRKIELDVRRGEVG